MKKLSPEIKEKILKTKRYNLKLMGCNPEPDSLEVIKPKELIVYLKNGRLFCKVQNKEEIEIIPFKNLKETPNGIDSNAFARIKKSIEENIPPIVKDKIELIESTSLVEYSLTEKHDYKFHIHLSPYSHWLTEEEAEEQILSYRISLTSENKKRYFEEEAKFIKFYKKIWSNYSTFFCFCDSPEEFYEFESPDELEKICKKSLREQKFIDFYVEEIELFISGLNDLEILICVNDFSIIESLQKQNFMEGLYLLNEEHHNIEF